MATHGIDPQARGLASRLVLNILAGLVPAANKMIYFTSASAAALTDLVSQARSFLADPSSAYVNFLQAGTGAVATTAQAKMRETVTPEDFGGGGAGLLLALASLTSGGTLRLKNGETYTVTRGTGSLLADTIPASNITIEGNGATIHGVPLSGSIGNDRYNQFYNIFQGTSLSRLRFRNFKVTGALSMAALYSCTDVQFDNVSDDGALAQGTTNALTITGITQAATGVLTYTGTDPANGDYFTITSVSGMTEINNAVVKVANVNAGANTFELNDIDGAAINTSGYTAYTSGGSATLCTNWLRDKSIYVDECRRVVVRASHIKNCSFGVYCIGDQVSTRCHSVKVTDCHFEIDAAGYTAFFPTGVYWVDINDGLTQGCTFQNIYSSVIGGTTGTGMGYGIYEGDGTSTTVKSIGDTFIYESSAVGNAAGYYLSEAQQVTIDAPTFDVQSGADVQYLALLDAKRVDTIYVVRGLNANVATGVDSYGIAITGTSTSTKAPKISISGCTIVGGTYAVRQTYLGNGSTVLSNNSFSGQSSTNGSVYFIGSSTVPIKSIFINGDRIAGGQGPAVKFGQYCINPRIIGCELLDGNLSNTLTDSGGAGAAVRMESYSWGLEMRLCRVGNTAAGGGLFTYAASNASSAADRIYKDLLEGNNLVSLNPGYGSWHRYHTASPTSGFFNISVGDFILNSDIAAGESPDWVCTTALRPALAADASSASATITIEAGYASSLANGMLVMLTKQANPDAGTYYSEAHMDTIASINVGANQVTLTTGIPAGLGTLVAGTAKLVFAQFKADAAIAA